MKTTFNHLAFLTTSIESTLKNNTFSNELIGKIEEFPSEGTRELYVGKEDQMGRLLLMQAIGDGPYKKAFGKRGAGLHHIALDVTDIKKFIDRLDGSGWLLHPKSLDFYKRNKQVYLCRPGIPVLIEVQEQKTFVDQDHFIERLEFPFGSSKLLDALCCDRLASGDLVKVLNIEGKQIYSNRQ